MSLSSGEGEPEGRNRAGLLVVAVIALAVAGAAFWYFTREEPAPASPPARPAPRATPTATPTPTPAAPVAAGTGTVEITGAEGAAVFVDGRRIGAAPRQIELEAGPHQVRVEKEGFRAFEREVQVIPGRTVALEARLEARGPRLSVTADVPGAQVFLDRKFLGEAPLVISDVEPGKHRLNVSAEGYEGYAEDIEVVPGPSEIQVRFKEVRLDESLAVKHRHGMGSCEGSLRATPQGLRYVTDHDKDGFTIPFSSLEPLEVDYLKKNLRVKVRGGRKYNFTADNADDLLTFQRAVEAARERLP